MPKEPLSGIRVVRQVTRFLNGIIIGNTTVGPSELANIEALATLETEDIEAVAAAAEVLGTVGAYEGEEDIAADLAAVVATVGDETDGLVKDVADLDDAINGETGILAVMGTYEGAANLATDLAAVVATVGDETDGLVKDVADLETDVGTLQDRIPPATLSLEEDTSEVYTYDSTPTGDLTQAFPADTTAATITPGGSTGHTLEFTLPVAKTCDMLVVTYDKGTHASTLTIGGVLVTGSGVLNFLWNGSAYVPFNTNRALTVPAHTRLVKVTMTADTNTLTLTMPSDGTLCVVNKDITGTAKVNVVTSLGVTESDVGDLNVYVCIAASFWANLASAYALADHTHA